MEAHMEILKKTKCKGARKKTRRGRREQVIFCFKFFEEETLNPL